METERLHNTPGPWTILARSLAKAVVCDQNKTIIAEVSVGNRHLESEANAVLIENAPALAKMLVREITVLDNIIEKGDISHNVRELLQEMLKIKTELRKRLM